jgi:hypothetical protein
MHRRLRLIHSDWILLNVVDSEVFRITANACYYFHNVAPAPPPRHIADVRGQRYKEYLERQNVFWNFYQESLESNSLLGEKVKNRRKNLEDNEKIAIFAQ